MAGRLPIPLQLCITGFLCLVAAWPRARSYTSPDTSCDSLARTIPAKASPVVFYCNGPKCRRSDNAVVIARDCGYSNIYWFRGGIEAWKASNYPVEK